MTERETKLFERLKGEGWFAGEKAPALFALYDLSDQKVPPLDGDGRRDGKKGRRRKGKEAKKEGGGNTPSRSGNESPNAPSPLQKGGASSAALSESDGAGGPFLCRGAALIDRDRVTLWQEGRLVQTIAIPAGERLFCEILEGTAVITLQDRVLFRARMKQKTAYYLLAKRYADLCEGKDIARQADERSAVCIKCGRPLVSGASDEVCSRCRSKKRVIKQLWEFLKGSRAFLFLSVFLFFAVTAINLVAPYLNRVLVDDYIVPKNSFLAGFAVVILSILGVNLLSRFVSILRSRLLIAASGGVIIRLRDAVFEKVEKLSVSNVAKRTAGNLMHRINNDTAVIQQFLTNQFANLVEQILMFLGVGLVLFFYDWRLALFILGPMPVVFILNWKFRAKTHKMYHTQWEKSSRVETFLHDIFSGIRVVKAFGTEERENRRFDALAYDECRVQMRNERFFAVFSPLITFLLGAGEIFLLYYNGYQNLYHGMSLGTISMFTSYVSLIYGPLQFFGGLLRQLANMLNSASKVFEILDEKVDVPDAEEPVVRRIEGNIELKNVAFDYDERNAVLKNINLTVRPGEMIGIVGRSGVGKSTLINLVMRMYDVDEGEILVDGINIKEYSQECLRSQIGAVLQETFLFSGSIYENIAYAKPEASREEIISASKLAGAHDFIIKLPDAYNTKVGERGYTLSGGERQRVTIARALLHDPRILILDEATSALDTETEKRIQDALQVLIQNRTTLAIAHRLSTLRNATRLIVLAEGTIAEEGTHEELMAKKGMYYELVMAQRQMLSTKKES